MATWCASSRGAARSHVIARGRRGPALRPGVAADALGQALPRRARQRGHQHAHQSPAFDPTRASPSSSTRPSRSRPAALAWRLVAFAQVDARGRSCATLERASRAAGRVTFHERGAGRARAARAARARRARRRARGRVDRARSTRSSASAATTRSATTTRAAPPRAASASPTTASRAVRLSGDADALASGEWLRDWLLEGRPVGRTSAALLMPSARRAGGFVPAGPRRLPMLRRDAKRRSHSTLAAHDRHAGRAPRRCSRRGRSAGRTAARACPSARLAAAAPAAPPRRAGSPEGGTGRKASRERRDGRTCEAARAAPW